MIRTMLRVLPLRDPGGQVLRCKHSRVALQNLFVRRLICTARGKPPTNPEGLSAATVMDMASNKATRFVYLRTLPLVKQPELDDRKVDVIAGHIEDMTRSLCEKHASSIVDDRAAVHLHMAALAIATHRVLGAHIQDEVRLSNIIRAGFGAELLAEAGESEEESQRRRGAEKRRPDFWIVRAALWFSWNRMKAVRRMTANMMRDFGDSFKKEAVDELDGDGRQRHCLRVCTLMSVGGAILRCREEREAMAKTWGGGGGGQSEILTELCVYL